MLNINQHSLESPLKELPVHVLRWEVQKIIEHYAEVFQCPRDFITSAVFGIVGTMCGRHVTIFDGKYRNHPNLWICHVAPSGSNKSSPIKALMQPMNKEESRRYKEFREKFKEFKRNTDEEEPTLNQLTVSDVTPEGLYKILDGRAESKDGLLLYRDEIKGFIDDMGRYHNSGEVSNYLSIWDGTTFPVTRKTQPPMYIENPFLNEKAILYEGVYVEPPKVRRCFPYRNIKEDDILSEVAACCKQIEQRGIDITDGYDQWLKVGCSLATLGEDGRDFFHLCSQQSIDYNESKTNKMFSDLLKRNYQNINIGTFFWLCKQNGIKMK